MLDNNSSFVGDWDNCYDGVHNIDGVDDWRIVVNERRLEAIEGPFTIAWIDASGGINLVRDGVGERTAYYYADSTRFVFASTLDAVLAAVQIDKRIDCISVARYLAYAYLPGAPTLIEGVFEVLPGEQLHWSNGKLTATRIWRTPSEPESITASEAQQRETLRTRLNTAIDRRLAGPHAIGASLSGGVDSSLVVALASCRLGAQINTYSVSFGDGYANELEWSSLVAQHCKTRHRVVEMAPELIAENFDRTIAKLDKPNGDPLTVPNYLLFEQASGDVRVMLNGEGGDPCFGGPKNLPMLLSELFGTGNMFEATNDSREARFLRAHQKCYDDFPRMLSDDMLEGISENILESEITGWLADSRYPSFINRLMAVNVVFKGAHHILPKVDALSAPHAVLARSPLFDRSVVAYAFSIPANLKLRGSVEKYLLKEAVRDLLPASVIERPKSGMLVPVEQWFQGPHQAFARERLLDGLAPYGLIRRDYLESLMSRRLLGHRPRIGIKIWLLLTLESWLRQHYGPA